MKKIAEHAPERDSEPNSQSSEASRSTLAARLFSLSSELDQLIGRVANSMARVNAALKSHGPSGNCSPQSLVGLSRLIKGEEKLQEYLEAEVRERMGQLSDIWEELRNSGNERDKSTAEMVGLKIAMLDYDLKCRSAGMASAAAFPLRRLHEFRRQKAKRLALKEWTMGFVWKMDVVVACLILGSSVLLGWPDLFSGMLAAGVLFLLAGLTNLIQGRAPLSGA